MCTSVYVCAHVSVFMYVCVWHSHMYMLKQLLIMLQKHMASLGQELRYSCFRTYRKLEEKGAQG